MAEDETIDVSHSYSVEDGAPTCSECTSNQGPEVELKEGQAVLSRLCVALQRYRQLWECPVAAAVNDVGHM